jgi:hypothetical protein
MSDNKVEYVADRISILCPTRMRPENVIRLVNSARSRARNPNLLEFIFYVDFDDNSFPDIADVVVIRGPRIWISLAHNAIYTHAKGEFLMTAGDDMEFVSDNWDTAIRDKFATIPDKIALVFGNDLSSYSGKIATHGFFHRNWVNALGVWVQPGRGCPWDLWSTDIAKRLGRFFYLENVLIKHHHYRQGLKDVVFDSTYSYVYSSNSAFEPNKTYNILERERRIDLILLSERMLSKPPIEIKYFLSTILGRYLTRYLSEVKIRKLLVLNNFQMVFFPAKYFLNLLKRSR